MTPETLIETYRAEQKWLFSLVTDPQGRRFFQPKSREAFLEQFEEGLRRTADFLAFAGHPERQFKAVHVAGTSGKGSVTMMLAALLHAAGRRTGQHTSPYLQIPSEKLVCDGRMIRPSEFIQLVRDFRALHGRWGAARPEFERLRYGEAWVALTFLWLARCGLDWGVVETGMGGRFDPTNVLPAELAVITNVDWDHARPLGPALTDIAWHKAGIIKAEKPALTAVTRPDLLAVITAEADRKRAPLYVLGRDFEYDVHSAATISVQAPFGQYAHVGVGAGGGYQLQNAALAIAAADVLAHDHGVPFTRASAHAALADFTCPGRMEVMAREPLVILDGAHNPHKMAALVESLQARYPDRRTTAVVGAIVSKDAGAMLSVLVPAVARLIVTQPHVPGKPAIPPAELADLVHTHSPEMLVDQAENARAALELALGSAGADELILVTGSLYLVGEARDYWRPAGQLLRESGSLEIQERET